MALAPSSTRKRTIKESLDESHSSVVELKQLNKLLERGFVVSEDPRGEVGRPKRHWSVSGVPV